MKYWCGVIITGKHPESNLFEGFLYNPDDALDLTNEEFNGMRFVEGMLMLDAEGKPEKYFLKGSWRPVDMWDPFNKIKGKY